MGRGRATVCDGRAQCRRLVATHRGKPHRHRGVDAGTPAASVCRANVANPAPVLANATPPSGEGANAARQPTPPMAAVAVFGPRRAEPRPSGRSSSSESGGHVVSDTDKGFAYDDGHHGQIRSFRSPPRRQPRPSPRAPRGSSDDELTPSGREGSHAPADATPGSLIAAMDVVFSQVRWRCMESTNDVLLPRRKTPVWTWPQGHGHHRPTLAKRPRSLRTVALPELAPTR